MKNVRSYAITIIVTLIVTLFILQFVMFTRVNGESMEPTYNSGNYLLVEKTKDVTYGDKVIVNCKEIGRLIVKRVIGKSGDVISCQNHVLYRNGKKLKEAYIKEKMSDSDWTVTVEDGKVFVMGDNRNNSADSRVFGSFETKYVIGKVVYKLF